MLLSCKSSQSPVNPVLKRELQETYIRGYIFGLKEISRASSYFLKAISVLKLFVFLLVNNPHIIMPVYNQRQPKGASKNKSFPVMLS